MTERICYFGPNAALFGVYTPPVASPAGPEAPALLWLNAGTLHHVGPFGWYAALARRLALQGFASLRFDLSGLGESPLRDAAGSALERAHDDTVVAMDFLACKFQAQRFVLVGLCSGAVLAHHVAARDPRVVGAVLVDGPGYRTPGFYLRRYGPRLWRPRAWFGAAGRLLGAAGRWRRQPHATALADTAFFDFPARDQARTELQRMLARGARLLLVYTNFAAWHYFNHPRQFDEAFGRLDPQRRRVEVMYLAEADHLLMHHGYRQAFFTRMETWMGPFAAPQPLAAAALPTNG